MGWSPTLLKIRIDCFKIVKWKTVTSKENDAEERVE